MNSYELSRSWFDWCFENPSKVKPIHSAIFFFAIEHCNRLGWKREFGFPSQMTMDAIGVRKYQTYGNALSDLVEWGFIKMIEKSKNQYSANIISINATPEKGKALDKALVKHGAKQGKSTGQSSVSINKQLNNQTKNKETYFEDEKLNTLFEDFIEHRKQMKKPMTDRSITMHVNKLNAESVPNAIKMIERSIEHGWSSLYELKEKDKVADDTAGDLENGWRVVPMSEAYEIVRDLSFTSMHEAELRGEGDEYVRKVMNARVQYEVHGNAWKTRK